MKKAKEGKQTKIVGANCVRPKKNKGITLIALVVTVIVMLILVSVTVSYSIQRGILSKAKLASFYQEMQAINEKKDISKILIFVNHATKEDENKYNTFLDVNVSIEELKDFPDTLKAEIIFTRSNYDGGFQISTKKIWKQNMYDCQDQYSDDWIGGLAQDLFYITKDASGKEKAYIYDRVADKCYKISQTKLGSYIVHSLEYAQLMIEGKFSNGISVAEMDTEPMESSDGVVCYEPDLNNFSYSTELIYYSEDKKNTISVPLKEYIENGKQKTKEVDGKTYTFADYSTENKIWANIKTNANGLESYWIWIPRYAYKLDASIAKKEKTDIIFINIENKQMDGSNLPNDYIVHEAFAQKKGLKGIWFSKYQPTAIETGPISMKEAALPDLSNFNSTNTKLVYYTLDGKSSIEVDYNANPVQSIEQSGKTYYFYNYSNKIWANVKTNANGLDSYWVWIPRYAYKLETGTTKVILIDENDKPLDIETYGDSLPSGYVVHEAFLQKTGLKGIWFSKYQPSMVQ